MIYIYHHNDHDGIVAAAILYNSITRDKQQIDLNMIDYNKELYFDHIDFDHDRVYFLDYSFSSNHNKNEFEELLKRRNDLNNIVWIDHHKSSINMFENYDISGVRKEGLCGAALTYLFIHQPDRLFDDNLEIQDLSREFHNDISIPVFLKYIDDYDCFKKLYPTTNDFHYGLTISSPTDYIITNLMRSSKCIDKIVFAGQAVQQYLKFDNREYHVNMYGFEYTLPEEHGGYKCFCLNRKGNSLMFGDKINQYDAVISFYFIDNMWKYSIFTNKNNVDCMSIAKSYGGGGHLKAAGWVIDEMIFQ